MPGPPTRIGETLVGDTRGRARAAHLHPGPWPTHRQVEAWTLAVSGVVLVVAWLRGHDGRRFEPGALGSAHTNQVGDNEARRQSREASVMGEALAQARNAQPGLQPVGLLPLRLMWGATPHSPTPTPSRPYGCMRLT